MSARVKGLPRSPRELDQLLIAMARMRSSGWYASAGDGRSPVDGDGKPLPWLSQPSIEWLDSVLRPEDTVLEWGCGHSTLWFAERVRSVTAIEHNEGWAANVSRRLPANAAVHFTSVEAADELDFDAPYVQAGRTATPNVVLVDGRARPHCARLGLEIVGNGLIVLDNADWQPAAHEVLRGAGMLHVDFVGCTPGSMLPDCTSVFSRDLPAWLGRARSPRRWAPTF